MTNSKAMTIASLTFVGTAGVMMVLCANAHIDFFPCKKTVRDYANADPITGESKLITTDGTCSLMGHLREGVEGEKDELTGAGWALLAAFCLGIAAADSALMYTVLLPKSGKTV
jgi:drug/metabolite transporter (DMT)-like permease